MLIYSEYNNSASKNRILEMGRKKRIANLSKTAITIFTEFKRFMDTISLNKTA
jgi:hypothetical protein